MCNVESFLHSNNFHGRHERIRLLMVSSAFQPAWDWGGPIKSMWNLARGLAGLGVGVTILTTNAKPNGVVNVPLIRKENGVKIVTETVVGGGSWSFANRYGLAIGSVVDIAKQIRLNDIVHVNGIFGFHSIEVAAMTLPRCKPYIISTRGELDKWSLTQKRLKKELFLWSVGKTILGQASGIHYTMEEEKKQAPYWLADRKGFVVPNAVEFGERGNAKRFQRNVELEKADLILGIFGRIHKKKGFNVMLPAIAECERKDVYLVIVGPDENGYKKRVEKIVREAGLGNRVIFTGMLTGDDLADAYAGVDLLVVPSYEENFGNVIVEAAVQGTPCLVSDQVGLKEWVNENQIGLVIPLDVNAWAAALGEIRREDIALKWDPKLITRHARESFSIENVAKKMLAQYQAILR